MVELAWLWQRWQPKNVLAQWIVARIGIDETKVRAHLAGLPDVIEVHDLHIWALSTTDAALSVHLVLADGTDHTGLLHRRPADLEGHFGIVHATFQLESTETARVCRLRSDRVV